MNKDIFNTCQSIEEGSPHESNNKAAHDPAVEFTVPVTPNVFSEEFEPSSSKWSYDRFMDSSLGKIYHEVLSRVKTIPADVPKAETAVKELWEGQGRWFNAEEVTSRVKDLLRNPNMAQFFPADGEVFNEKEYCDSLGNLYRMDKVIVDGKEVRVVDFKTGTERKDHGDQIRKYMGLLKELHKDKVVRGFMVHVMEKYSEEIK